MRAFASVILTPLILLSGCTTADVTDPATIGRDVSLFETARLGTMAVTPFRVIEDSRCAIGVQCIQAGTVRIAVRIESGSDEREGVLALGVPADLGGIRANLTRVCPYPVHGSPIAPPDYRFTLVLASVDTPPSVGPAGCSPEQAADGRAKGALKVDG